MFVSEIVRIPAGAMFAQQISLTNTPLPRRVRELRGRRSGEQRVQHVFEELIATMRAEDPALAAEEARKLA